MSQAAWAPRAREHFEFLFWLHFADSVPVSRSARPRARERFETCFLCRFWCSSEDANMSTSSCRAYQDITWEPIPSQFEAGCNKRCNEAAMQPAIYLPTSYLGSTLVSFCLCILLEICSIPEHAPEALVAAIRSGSSLRFGCTDRELCSSILSPV